MPRAIAEWNWQIPNPDPTRAYRWVADNPKRLNLMLMSWGEHCGYSIVQGGTLEETRAKAEALGFSVHLVDARNRIVFGDAVLCDIPIEEAIHRDQARVDEQLEKVYEIEQRVHETADNIPGIRTYVQDPEETADRKRFASEDRPFSGQTGVGKSPAFRSKKS